MYNDDATRIPTDEAELGRSWRAQFEYVRHVLRDVHVETKEEALENGDDRGYRQGMGVIRYRDTGVELDQRDLYLAMGRELLPYIHQSLDEKKLTPEFVQQLGENHVLPRLHVLVCLRRYRRLGSASGRV